MQITVTVTVDVPPGSDVDHVAERVAAAGEREAHHQQATAAALGTPTMAVVRSERAAALRGPGAAAAATAPPAWRLVGPRGGWVARHDNPGGMAGKGGVVATEAVPVGRHGRRQVVRRPSVATFGDSDHVGLLTSAAAAALGGEQAGRQTVGGDGAAWLTTQAALHFPTAPIILAGPHLAGTVPAGIRAARPGRGNREVRRQPYATIRGLLWDGAVEAAATEVADRPPAEVAPVAALEEALRYLATQRDWLGDDGAWRAAGEPVGSGVIARAVAVVSTWRMQRRGRRWRRRTAHAVVALRVRFRNADWDQRQRPLAAA